MRGVSGDVLQTERGVASRDCGATAAGRLRDPNAFGLAAGAREVADGPAALSDTGRVVLRPKIATVERREAPSRSRGTARVSLARCRASQARLDYQCASRRSAHPSSGVGREEESKNPGRKNAPRERRKLRCLTL